MIELVFTDNGSGVSPAHLSRVFDPFFSTKEADRGAGLGLYYAKVFAEDHGGSIAIRSTLGRSTDIVLLLPVADLSLGNASARGLDATRARKIRVLFFNPSEADSPSLTEAMGQREWEVKTVSTTEHVRRMIKEEGVKLHALVLRPSQIDSDLRILLAELHRDHPGLPIALGLSVPAAAQLASSIRSQVDLVFSTDIADRDAVESLAKFLRLS
jgi:hypothetical protein